MKKISMKTTVIAVAVIAVAIIVSVIVATSAPAVLRVATTTSLYDTELWDALEPIFEQRYDVALQITAKGTGMALELGKNGDVDVVTVHDPLQEAAFIAGGYAVEAEGYNGTARVPWAYNYFIVIGPETDSAGISGLTPEEAFQKIQQEGEADPETVKFVSRGDNSGTHGKEKAVWTAAGYNYTTDIQGTGATAGWYLEAGSSMGATLVMANEKIAYTLTDKGTFLAYQGDLDLVTLVDTGDIMLNVYTVIICKNGSNPEMAQNLVTFLRAPEIQALIAGFGVPQYGEPLFYPYDPEICQ
ncbi:MAG: substrate-binding domain-containing protein [Dehalococcoidia bacterium]|nr:substrate-binding domain-containing protein [Dehalococcoidia bacterium]